MPLKFDRYENPQVRPTGVDVGPASQMPVSGNSGASDVAEGGRSVAKGLLDLGEKFQRERKVATAFAAEDAEIQFASEASDLLYNAESGFLNAQGKGAMDTAAVHEKIEAARQKYAGSIASEEARVEYDTKTRVRALGYKQVIEMHAGKERRGVYEATAGAALDTAKREAVAVYLHPELIEQKLALALDDPKGAVMTYLRDVLELPESKINQMKKEYESDVYEAVLNEYKNREQPAPGLKYLDSVRDTLGARASAWDAAFRKLNEVQETELLSTQAWQDIESQATDPVTRRFNPELARGALVERYQPDVRARIEQEIEKEIAVAEKVQADNDRQAIARLSKGIIQTNNVDRLAPDYVNLDDTGQDTVERMLRAHRRELRGDDAQVRREQAALDSIAESQFYQIPSIEERAALAEKLDEIDGMFPDASTKMRERIKRHAVTAALIVKKDQQASYKEFRAQVEDAAKALPKKRAEKFRVALSAWYDSQIMNDVALTDEQVRQTINEKLRMRETVGSNEYDFELENPEEYDLADYQPVERARNLTARPKPPARPVPVKKALPPPKPGKVWIERDGKQGQVSESMVRPTDKRL